MKKGAYITLCVFTGLTLLGFIFSILGMVLPYGTYVSGGYDAYYGYYSGGHYELGVGYYMSMVSGIVDLISVIGTFVCSIVGLVGSKHLTCIKGLVKATCILGIVASSVVFVFSIIAFTGLGMIASILVLIGSIAMLVVFGLSIASTIKINKAIKTGATA